MPGASFCNSEEAGENRLERVLIERIRARGPLSFAAFMDAALYEPRLGYYTSGRTVWGVDGDYTTAPAVHPAFGACIARLTIELDDVLGGPRPLDLVELGGGNGRLSGVVRERLREQSHLWRRLRAGFVEVSPEARRAALQELSEPGEGVWAAASVAAADGEGPLEGLVFCNELLDALPVERVQLRQGRLLQSRIEVRDGVLVESFGAPVAPAVRDHLRRHAIELREGQIAEVCLELEPLLAAIGRRLERGALLVIDYGHETETLYGDERLRGSLVCMRRFRLGDDPLAVPGRQDITAHVDFGSLRRLGRRAGFTARELCSLRVFLLGFGAADRQPEDPAERLALRHLLMSEIGDAHKAMLLTRGLPEPGLEWGRERLRPSC